MRWLQPNLESLLSTDGTCFVCECVVVGEPAVHTNRRRSVKPGEERQLLQVVVKSVDRACDRGNVRTGQRITDLQVALASAHLADVPPQRRRIVAKRVVHPFADFVSRDRNVTNSGTEETCGVKVKWREGLDRRTDRIMEPKYAALVQIVWYTDRHHHVVHQKYWELRSVDSLCGQQLEQNREYGVDVDNSQRSAGAEKTRRNGKSLVCREYKVNGREHVRVEHRMVIRALQREVAPLESVYIYCVVPTDVGPKLKSVAWNIGDCTARPMGTLLGELRQALSATVGSNVVNPLILERIPPLLTLKATDFVVMIKGMIGVSTVVVVNGPEENGSCPTITPE